MSARDDFGSNAGRPGGYGGGAGGLGNGGVGGGMGGGFGGGGAGRMGGMGNRTGLTTGNRMYGGMAMGRPGGLAQNMGAWGMRPQAPVQQGPMGQPPGLLGNPTPASIPGVNPVPEYVPVASSIPNPFNAQAYRAYAASIGDFRNAVKNQYGWGAGNPNITPNAAPSVGWDETYQSFGTSEDFGHPAARSTFGSWPGQSAIPPNGPTYNSTPAPDLGGRGPLQSQPNRGWGGGLGGIWN